MGAPPGWGWSRSLWGLSAKPAANSEIPTCTNEARVVAFTSLDLPSPAVTDSGPVTQ